MKHYLILLILVYSTACSAFPWFFGSDEAVLIPNKIGHQSSASEIDFTAGAPKISPQLTVDNVLLNGSSISALAGSLEFQAFTTNFILFDTDRTVQTGQTAATAADFILQSADGDGTDDNKIQIYGVGSGANSEWLDVGWSNTDSEYQLFTSEAGTGVDRAINIYSGAANEDQLLLETDGQVGIGGAASTKLDVSGSISSNGLGVEIESLIENGGFEDGSASVTANTGTLGTVADKLGLALEITLGAGAVDVEQCITNTNWVGEDAQVTCDVETDETGLQLCIDNDTAGERDCVDHDGKGWRTLVVGRSVPSGGVTCWRALGTGLTTNPKLDNCKIGKADGTKNLLDSEVSFTAMETTQTNTLGTSPAIVILDENDGATLETFDPLNTYNTTTGIFTAPEPGRYFFRFLGQLTNNADEIYSVHIQDVSTSNSFGRFRGRVEAEQSIVLSGYADLVKGQQVGVYSDSTGDASYQYAGGNTSFIGFKLPTNSENVITPLETVAIVKATSSVTATGVGPITLIFPTEAANGDLDNLYNTTTGEYTCSKTGWYEIEGAIDSTGQTWSVGHGAYISAYVAGALDTRLGVFVSETTTSVELHMQFAGTVFLQKDEVLLVRINQDNGGVTTLDGKATSNWITIAPVGKAASLLGLDVTPIVEASKRSSNAGNTIASGTFTYIDYDDLEFDLNGNFTGCGSGNVTTHNTGCKFIVPADGKYRLNAKLTFQTSQLEATEQYNMYVRVNNIARAEGLQQSRFTSGTKYWELWNDTILDLLKDDIVEIVFLHDTLTNQTPLSDGLANIWEMVKIDQGGTLLSTQEIYRKEATVALDNDFNSGELHIQRIGSMVTVFAPTLGHGVLSFASSTTGLIPTWARPSTNNVTNTIYQHPSGGWQMTYRIRPDGTFDEWTIDEAGAPLGSSGQAGGSITYSIK